MLLGEYRHTIDDKKRISLPVKFRKELGRKVVMTHGLDNCLFLYSEREWGKISEKLGNLSLGQADSRRFNRFILGGAIEIEADGNGRILIPEHLREFAKLESKVVFAGVHNRVEIWDESKWIEYKKKVALEADALAEKLGSIGAI